MLLLFLLLLLVLLGLLHVLPMVVLLQLLPRSSKWAASWPSMGPDFYTLDESLQDSQGAIFPLFL